MPQQKNKIEPILDKKARRKSSISQWWSEGLPTRIKRDILIIFLLAFGAILFLSLIGVAGTVGDWLRNGLGLLFGWGKWLVPFWILAISIWLLSSESYPFRLVNGIGLTLLLLSLLGLLQLFEIENHTLPLIHYEGGGYIGYGVGYPLYHFFGGIAAVIICLAVILISLLLTLDTTLSDLLAKKSFLSSIWQKILQIFSRFNFWRGKLKNKVVERLDKEEREEIAPAPSFSSKIIKSEEPISLQPKVLSQEPLPAIVRHQKIDIPIDLLDNQSTKPLSGDIEANKEKIRKALENFGIPVEMGEVNVGPAVTQFTLRPHDGVKLAQITALANDLSLTLAAHPLRIEAPIPGKSLVGIEIPNEVQATVRLRELLEDKGFKKRSSNLTIALGRDVSGAPWFDDLGSMPHMLIAGATGSGKTVCVNSIIISFLYQNSPEMLKFILIDPKRVELTVYNNIPYLLTPVITSPDKAVNSLKWAVAEMDRRYNVLSEHGVNNIARYNALPNLEEKMPQIVIMVDELADLMATAPKDIEAAIIRLTQMSRAVGIHLVLATQRPEVRVITGLIKANITSRVAFNVASSVDSRTIIDTMGAEKLIGKGDMLYISARLTKPRRIQGIFITPQEIQRVVEFIKTKGEPSYVENVTQNVSRTTVNGATVSSGDGGDDELLQEAKQIIFRTDKASASLLQRHLRIGYARAARLLDLLEEEGIIGPADGAKPREVYYTTDMDKDNSTQDEEESEDMNQESGISLPAGEAGNQEVAKDIGDEIEEDVEEEQEMDKEVEESNEEDDNTGDEVEDEEEEMPGPGKSIKKDSYIGKFDDDEKF